MLTKILFETAPGRRILAALEERYNLAVLTEPLRFVDARALANTPIPYWPIAHPLTAPDAFAAAFAYETTTTPYPDDPADPPPGDPLL